MPTWLYFSPIETWLTVFSCIVVTAFRSWFNSPVLPCCFSFSHCSKAKDFFVIAAYFHSNSFSFSILKTHIFVFCSAWFSVSFYLVFSTFFPFIFLLWFTQAHFKMQWSVFRVGCYLPEKIIRLISLGKFSLKECNSSLFALVKGSFSLSKFCQTSCFYFSYLISVSVYSHFLSSSEVAAIEIRQTLIFYIEGSNCCFFLLHWFSQLLYLFLEQFRRLTQFIRFNCLKRVCGFWSDWSGGGLWWSKVKLTWESAVGITELPSNELNMCWFLPQTGLKQAPLHFLKYVL